MPQEIVDAFKRKHPKDAEQIFTDRKTGEDFPKALGRWLDFTWDSSQSGQVVVIP